MEDELLPLIRSCGIRPVLGAPLSEIFSINIFPNSGETCEVYGEINIIDEDGTSYEIYSLDSDEPEIITSDHTSLDIWVPLECSFSTTWSRLSIHLMTGDNVSFIDGDLKLPKITDSNFDQVQTRTLYGAQGRACVKYTTFLAAIYCHVKFIINKDTETETDMEKTELYGTITASYTNTYTRQFPEIELFEEMSDWPSSLDFPQTFVELEFNRPRVAVPAYSFLKLDFKLYNAHSGEVFFKDKLAFLPKFRSYGRQLHRINGFSIEVKAYWDHPYEMDKLMKCPEVWVNRERECYSDALELTEVFAVLVCHNVEGLVKMCGNFSVGDWDIPCQSPFERSVWLPVLLGNRATIPLEGPENCYRGHECFSMGINLYDTQSEVLVKGNLTWLLGTLASPTSFYDKRICSVAKGVNCYACVFYSMFTNAMQACIEVSFVPRGDFEGVRKVYGTIVARYSNQEYSSEYEKLYYQSVILNTSEEHCLEFKSSRDIPLLKSVVAVPTTSSLIVEVDLKVVYGKAREYLKSKGEFDFEKGVVVAPEIEGASCGFKLSVKWSGVKARPPPRFTKKR